MPGSIRGLERVADLFGVTGRRWLAEVELPLEEHESVDAGGRQIVFLAAEIKAVEKRTVEASVTCRRR
jgi:ABC-type proline/glycine betaine transport system permease subunit